MKNVKLFILMLFLVVSCGTGGDSAESGDVDFSFAFLTDIHLQEQKLADKGFMKAIRHVNRQAPDFVITGGDLIMDALGESEAYSKELYTMYTRLQEEFDMPVYNTLGNHELFGVYERSGITPDHPLYAEGMYESFLGKPYYAFDRNGWRFYILDSAEETEERTYIGYIDSLQLEWIRQDLSSVDPGTPIAISTHIPLITSFSQIRGGSMNANGRGLVVENSKAVLDLFENHNLKLVLQGHLHTLEDIYAEGIHFITGGAVSARWWNGPNGTLEEGYLLVKVRGESLDWEYLDYGWEAVSQEQPAP